MEAHNGSTADGRQTGLEILVYDDPNDVFVLKTATVYTLTGGSTTTAVISGLLPATDDIMNGGYIKIVTCAANSALIGRVVKISDHTGSGGTLTLAETLPSALAASDTIQVCPGRRAIGHYAYDLNSDGTDIDITDSSAGEALFIEGSEPDQFKLYIRFRLHQKGNDAAAKA